MVRESAHRTVIDATTLLMYTLRCLGCWEAVCPILFLLGMRVSINLIVGPPRKYFTTQTLHEIDQVLFFCWALYKFLEDNSSVDYRWKLTQIRAVQCIGSTRFHEWVAQWSMYHLSREWILAGKSKRDCPFFIGDMYIILWLCRCFVRWLKPHNW